MSKTDAAILGMLTVEPMSGYDMMKFCEKSLVHFWHESYGNLYPRLKRLEAEGLVRGRKEPRDRAPDATVYSLTAAGRRRFLEWLQEEPQPEQVRSDFMLRIFNGAHLGPEGCARRIREYRRQQEAIRDSYAETERMLREDLHDRPEAFYWLMSLRRGQLLTDARLRWCSECAEMIDAREATEAT